MKKNSILLLLIVFTIANLSAQNEDYKLTISANAGYSLSASLVKAALEASNSASGGAVETGGMPVAAQLNADYGLSKLFSIGLALSYQTISADFANTTYDWSNMPNYLYYSSIKPLYCILTATRC